ncbi:MAG TPA: kelch repeat-containing protein, partial [Chloroflexota bacterium]
MVALSPGGQVQVTVSPSTANVPIGGSQQFTATVAGTDDRDVTWSVQEGNGAGAIDSGGGYYPGAAAGTFHVVATSVADRTAMGTAAVLVPGFIYNNLLAPRDRYAATLLLTGEVLITGGNNPGTFPDAELYDPGTNTSSAIGDMNTSRPLGGHTATRLQDGTVLIAGGQTASAETYDPVMMVFSPTSSMSIARCRHTATLLPNGNVLIAGGYSDSGTVCGGFALATAELYSPVTGMFTPTGRMNTPRGDHTASLLPTGQVLIAGGNNGAGVVVATAELYDPIRGTFTPAGTMGTPRNRHTATLLQNGKVLVAGGLASGDDFPLATAELYDPVSGMFAATGGMMAGRQSHTATLLPNGNVLVADKTADLYDPGTGVFSATGALMTLHRRATATLLPNAEVWIPGGFDGNGGSAAAELYDPARGIFHSSLMSMGRISASATMLQNGKVLVAGGSSSPGTDLYDPATGTFAATASMSTGRFSATATL